MAGIAFKGRVTCEARVENEIDGMRVRTGAMNPSEVRSISISEVVVDTSSASMIALPTRMLRQLGLEAPSATRSWNTTDGEVVKLFGPVRLWVGDRDIVLDAEEVADGCPVLIGQIPLEHLQLVVDMSNHRLEKSPANGGEWILDMF